MWKASADRFTRHSRSKRRQWVVFHWSYRVPFKYTWGFLWSWLLSNSEHSFFSWWKTCLYGVAFWEILYIQYPANYLGNSIFLSEAYLCNHEDFVFLKPLERQMDSSTSILTWLDLVQLLYGQQKLPVLHKAKPLPNFTSLLQSVQVLVNYLQVLIRWPKQITSPLHFVFWGSQIFWF